MSKRTHSSNKMQEVDFKSIDEFLAFLPEDELVIVERLRKLVFYCLPEAREKLSFNVPYYYHHRNFCFIWPASVTWGKNKTYEGVRFGFAYGHQLTDEIGYLDKGGRKQIYWKDFTSIKEIDAELLKTYIYEAIYIDEDHFRKKKMAGKK
jgi:uncharacterized protein YdhG (YjbR/CyaY superfamily)